MWGAASRIQKNVTEIIIETNERSSIYVVEVWEPNVQLLSFYLVKLKKKKKQCFPTTSTSTSILW